MSQGTSGAAVVPGHPAIVCLSLTKALDATTTAVGLAFVPGVVEANPFAAALFAAVGVFPGLLLASLAVLAFVVAITETGAAWLARRSDAPEWAPVATRTVGYLPPSLVFGAAAVHNAALLWVA